MENTMRDPTTQTMSGVVNVIPPAAVSFADTVLNLPVEKWLTITLIVYTILQGYLLIRDRIIRRRRFTDEVKDEAE